MRTFRWHGFSVSSLHFLKYAAEPKPKDVRLFQAVPILGHILIANPTKHKWIDLASLRQFCNSDT